MTRLTGTVLAIGLLSASTASATETITYTYDARGRLIKVVQDTSDNDRQTCYKYDKADNRTNVKTDVNATPACPSRTRRSTSALEWWAPTPSPCSGRTPPV